MKRSVVGRQHSRREIVRPESEAEAAELLRSLNGTGLDRQIEGVDRLGSSAPIHTVSAQAPSGEVMAHLVCIDNARTIMYIKCSDKGGDDDSFTDPGPDRARREHQSAR